MTFDDMQLRPRTLKPLPQPRPRRDLRFRGLPFTFGERVAGEGTEGWRSGFQKLYQAASARTGRMTRFAAVGALGTLVNLLVMALLVHGLVDINYVPAAVVAAEVSILHNFVLQERFVFRDMRDGAGSWRARLTHHQLFNSAEALVRLPFLILLVDLMHIWALLAQAVTLALAFVGRFLFTSRVVYRRKQPARNREPATP
ncbi:putative flippase GtrA [Pseudarthrobacter siccitolerans]|uniref:Flippase GtrA n=1 Tax=Pseudarthrobacter siccitolerans TaxID=861266 RepID=A0ABU0PJ46_9MICC|nr:GtrA family protein [Pseudarthrobacter siccitolerans]MDQ0673988.1 putative flippase GtrA [Pseudarthrobacter siccitolerans]